jgi:hypothetical protein
MMPQAQLHSSAEAYRQAARTRGALESEPQSHRELIHDVAHHRLHKLALDLTATLPEPCAIPFLDGRRRNASPIM